MKEYLFMERLGVISAPHFSKITDGGWSDKN